MSNDDLRSSYQQNLDTMFEALQQPIAFHRSFALVAGSVAGGVMLSQLFYWTRIKGLGQWIYKTHEEMEFETTLTRREQDTARRRLQQMGVVETKLSGVPPKIHYRIDFQEMVRRIDGLGDAARGVSSNLAESANLNGTKAPNLFGGKRQVITESTSEITPESIYKRRTRIPKDFSLSQAMLVYATSKGIQQPQQEFEKFREYYEAKGTVWLDWVKVWQQWCRNAAERKHDGLYANRNNEREQVAGRDFAPFLEK